MNANKHELFVFIRVHSRNIKPQINANEHELISYSRLFASIRGFIPASAAYQALNVYLLRCEAGCSDHTRLIAQGTQYQLHALNRHYPHHFTHGLLHGFQQ